MSSDGQRSLWPSMIETVTKIYSQFTHRWIKLHKSHRELLQSILYDRTFLKITTAEEFVTLRDKNSRGHFITQCCRKLRYLDTEHFFSRLVMIKLLYKFRWASSFWYFGRELVTGTLKANTMLQKVTVRSDRVLLQPSRSGRTFRYI